jgi:hypothetical protein
LVDGEACESPDLGSDHRACRAVFRFPTKKQVKTKYRAKSKKGWSPRNAVEYQEVVGQRIEELQHNDMGLDVNKQLGQNCEEIEKALVEAAAWCKEATQDVSRGRVENKAKLRNLIQKRRQLREPGSGQDVEEVRDVSKQINKEIRRQMRQKCKDKSGSILNFGYPVKSGGPMHR